MKRLKRKIYATTHQLDIKHSLMPSEVVRLLNEIVQLQGMPITAEESPEGMLQFVVGSDIYTLLDAVPTNDMPPEGSLTVL